MATEPTAVTELPVPRELAAAYADAIERFAGVGTWLDGATRRAIVIEARRALECDL